MQQLQEAARRPTTPPSGAPLTEAATDVSGLAGAASARAAAVPRAPATVTVTVKTTAAQATEIVATPDTTIGEIMARACADLGVRDAARHLLVANGEVIADGARTLRDVAGEQLHGGLTTRLVKKPEAGAPGPCRS
jgi:hypothetical protein